MADDNSTRLTRSGAGAAPYTARQGRKFAITIAAAFAVLSAVTFRSGREIASLVLGTLAVALLLAALIAPARLESLERGWMSLARAISRVTTPIVMGIVYFAVLTPAGIVRRTLGRNALDHRPADDSYWIARVRSDPEAGRRRMERQF